MEKGVVVTVHRSGRAEHWGPAEASRELTDLVSSTGIEIRHAMVIHNREPNPRSLIPSGKLEELVLEVRRHRADVVVFDSDLSGTQQRNLEDALKAKTIDRTQLILDIFARRARSSEGKVQVELAQLNYLLPRLGGKGILLSRLGGGIGTRGPGEQKLEMDRRRIRSRIQKLGKELQKLSERRLFDRTKRAESRIPTVALVGYTNSGKSTLFNAFTGSSVVVQDRLFSTLDPTVRRYILPNRQKVLFIDTVGFLHLLPHHLIDAFKATLEEVTAADMLFHVMDVSSPLAALQERSVGNLLTVLGAESKPRVLVLNKADRLDSDPGRLVEAKKRWSDGVVTSALYRRGLTELVGHAQKVFENRRVRRDFFVPSASPDLVAWIYRQSEIVSRRDTAEGVFLTALAYPERSDAIQKRLACSDHPGSTDPPDDDAQCGEGTEGTA